MLRAGVIRVLLISIALISLSVGVAPLSALQKGGNARSAFVNLEVLAPAPAGNRIPTELIGGWPLTLRLTGNNDLGIGRSTFPPAFPVPGYNGFLVFADPDGCGSWVLGPPPEGGGTDWVPICSGEPDETYVEFSPGEGIPTLSYENNPTIKAFNFESNLNDKEVPVGPPTGPAGSGYGFGRSGRLPGLMILADTGVGVVLDQNFELVQPRRARNLAGFIGSVAYELNDATKRTSIVAHMTVPRSLFVPLILGDRAIGDCEGVYEETWVRVDGGPVKKITPGLNTLECVVEGQIVTIRAFVVNRNAPDVLDDMNADGVVNAQDAMMAGFELLSNEVLIRIKHHYQAIELFGIFYDLDGNGCIGGIVIPTGAGGLTRAPR